MGDAGKVMLDIIQLLLSLGANINTKDEDGFSPLYQAAADGNLQIVEYLLDNGADIEIKSNDDTTPLIIASCYDQLENRRIARTKKCRN